MVECNTSTEITLPQNYINNSVVQTSTVGITKDITKVEIRTPEKISTERIIILEDLENKNLKDTYSIGILTLLDSKLQLNPIKINKKNIINIIEEPINISNIPGLKNIGLFLIFF
jgi:hypothetical protein